MKSVLRNIGCLVCVSALLLSSVACGKSAGPKSTASGSTPQTAQKQDPVKLKIWASTLNQETPSVSNLMDIPIIKYMADKTNTIIDLELIDAPKFWDITKMRFASGEYPDIYCGSEIALETVVTSGLVQELNDLVDKFGPNMKKNIPQSTWDAATLGGKIMGVPGAQNLNSPAERVLYVRGDWMDKAGIKTIPKTSDELLNMFRAFRDTDCNGNGQKDEIAFSGREKLTWMDNIFGMWGTNFDSYSVVNGEVVPGFINPNAKKGIEFMANLYKEKLLDSEFLTNTGTIWQNKIKQNRVGSWNSTIGNAVSFYNSMKDANPGKNVNLITIPTPQGTGYTGPVGRVLKPTSSTSFLFKNSKQEVKEAAIKFIDWCSTEEGALLCKYGIEGDTVVKNADGTYTYDQAKQKTEQTLWMQNFVRAELDSINLKIKTPDPKADKLRDDTIALSRKEGIPNPLAPMPAPVSLTSKPDLKIDGTLPLQTISRIIFGELPISAYDDMVEKWKKSGGDAVIKESTDWYKANAKK